MIPKDEKMQIIIISILYLLLRLPLLNFLPFTFDENLHFFISEELKENPTLLPQFFGYPISWKPSLFFYMNIPFSYLPFGEEVNYRLSSFLFGFGSVLMIYFVFKNLKIKEELCFLSPIAFLFSFISSYPSAAFLPDSAMFFFILCGIYTYTKIDWGEKRFLLAGIFGVLAFFMKLVVAFMIPVLGLIYLYQYEPKNLKNKYFLISLFFIPIALLIHSTMIDSAGLGKDATKDISQKIFNYENIESKIGNILVSAVTVFINAGFLFSLSIFGFWKNRENLFMCCWYLLSIIPLLSSGLMMWYYLPVLPAIVYFALLTLAKFEGKFVFDKLFFVVFTIFILLNSYGMPIVYLLINERSQAEKDAGEFLANKENVLIVGNYAPGILTYKYIAEKGKGQQPAWTLFMNWSKVKPLTAYDFIDKYQTIEGEKVSKGSFNELFTEPKIFIRDSNISHFEYIVVVSEPTDDVWLNYSLIQQYLVNKIQIYKRY